MDNPKVLNDFLSGNLPVVKTDINIPTQTLINLMVAFLLMLVLAFLAYKMIVKR